MLESTKATTPASASSTSCNRAVCEPARAYMARTTPEKPSSRPISFRAVSGSRNSQGASSARISGWVRAPRAAMVRSRSGAVASDMQGMRCPRRLSVAGVRKDDARHETLCGVPPRREPDERENARAEEGLRGCRIRGRQDGALEWKRGLQRARGAASGPRGESRGGDEETPRKRFPHHRAPDPDAPQHARFRSLPRLPVEAWREAGGHVLA